MPKKPERFDIKREFFLNVNERKQLERLGYIKAKPTGKPQATPTPKPKKKAATKPTSKDIVDEFVRQRRASRKK